MSPCIIKNMLELINILATLCGGQKAPLCRKGVATPCRKRQQRPAGVGRRYLSLICIFSVSKNHHLTTVRNDKKKERPMIDALLILKCNSFVDLNKVSIRIRRTSDRIIDSSDFDIRILIASRKYLSLLMVAADSIKHRILHDDTIDETIRQYITVQHIKRRTDSMYLIDELQHTGIVLEPTETITDEQCPENLHDDDIILTLITLIPFPRPETICHKPDIKNSDSMLFRTNSIDSIVVVIDSHSDTSLCKTRCIIILDKSFDTVKNVQRNMKEVFLSILQITQHFTNITFVTIGTYHLK